jgi:hypothetical protein
MTGRTAAGLTVASLCEKLIISFRHTAHMQPERRKPGDEKIL